jgi:hypothetical protein
MCFVRADYNDAIATYQVAQRLEGLIDGRKMRMIRM